MGKKVSRCEYFWINHWDLLCEGCREAIRSNTDDCRNKGKYVMDRGGALGFDYLPDSLFVCGTHKGFLERAGWKHNESVGAVAEAMALLEKQGYEVTREKAEILPVRGIAIGD